MTNRKAAVRSLAKTPSGIQGFDEITGGGLPRGRPTLVCGRAGCGKTLLAMEFLVRGIAQYHEPGVFMTFEETAEELKQNVQSLGFDVERLASQKKLVMDFVRVERSEIDETGDYDLEGLFVRLGHAIDTIGARRVVIDSIETLFAGLSNQAILRAELRRLFRWLKDKGVTAVVTGERGEGTLTRHGLEEYVSDCVILLDHRVTDQISTRRLRVVKYRGTTHGTNEYPFVIDETGFTVLPITSLGLAHEISDERVSSGIPGLDNMLGAGGYYRGSTVLVSGTAGSGKTSVAAHFAQATCHRGRRCLYLAFEESPAQVRRNMRSIGLDLDSWATKGTLRIQSTRPALYGLEMHLALLHKAVQEFQPESVVLDPVTSLLQAGTVRDAILMLTRVVDFLKAQGITTLITALTSRQLLEETDAGISSMVDTWLLVRDEEVGGERNRLMHILKSRGMAHTNQLREFLLTNQGIELREVYLGPEGVLSGSARLSQEAREKADMVARRKAIDAIQRERDRKREALEARIVAMRKEFDAEERDAEVLLDEARRREAVLDTDREAMSRMRRAGPIGTPDRVGKTRGGRR
jgi:circadian clock protein KaiC